MEYFNPIMKWLMVFGWPLAAILFGAVLPPIFFCTRRRALAVILTVAGLLFYHPVSGTLPLFLLKYRGNDELAFLLYTLKPLIYFALIQGGVFLLICLVRRVRRWRQRAA